MAVVVENQRVRLAVAAVAAFVVVFGGVRLLERARAAPSGGSARVSVDAGEPPASPAPASGSGSSSGAAGSRLYVDVAGEVRRPGLYRVARGSRIAVAVQMAGGFTGRAETTQVNLAAPLQDGQQVIVPPRGGGGAAGGPVGLGAAGKRPVSLSTATADDLDSLDGIGPTLAGRIVEYRQAHGGFHSIDELRQVDGIGDKRFQQLKKALQP
jgi:competence protein ComEA